MYTKFLSLLQSKAGESVSVKDGVFGAMMEVNIKNDGPVTIIIDSANR